MATYNAKVTGRNITGTPTTMRARRRLTGIAERVTCTVADSPVFTNPRMECTDGGSNVHRPTSQSKILAVAGRGDVVFQ